MLTVIMAGGMGTRILEETQQRPKALVRIGDKPIIAHIMDGYQRQGFRDFLILTGYKGEQIHDYFKQKKDVITFRESDNCLEAEFPGYNVTVAYTGENAGTAERLRLARSYVNDERFMLTYCDALCQVSLEKLLRFHEEHGGMVTLTAVRPKPRFGILELDERGYVRRFQEKDRKNSPVINGGFMVVEPGIFDFLTEGMENLEKDVLAPLAEKGKLTAYLFDGFWQCMDTLQEKNALIDLWKTKQGYFSWLDKDQ